MQPVIPSVMRHLRGIDGAHRLWQRAGSLVWVLALLLGMASATPSFAAAQTSDETAAVLDGRIGGSLDAFEAKYGEPTNDPAAEDGAGVERAYANKNYREMVAITFSDRISGVAFAADLPTTRTTNGSPGALRRRLRSPNGSSRRMRMQRCGVNGKPSASNPPAPCSRSSRGGYPGLNGPGDPTVSFTLTLDEADDTAVTAMSAAAGTMSLKEEAAVETAAVAYLTAIKIVYDGLPETFTTIDSAIGGAEVGEMMLIVTLAYWTASYSTIAELDPPAAYADLHGQFVEVLKELDSAATTIAQGSQTGDSASVQLGVAHYYRGVMLYEEFKPVMEDALTEAGLA